MLATCGTQSPVGDVTNSWPPDTEQLVRAYSTTQYTEFKAYC